jgi:hypothetical protein
MGALKGSNGVDADAIPLKFEPQRQKTQFSVPETAVRMHLAK